MDLVSFFVTAYYIGGIAAILVLLLIRAAGYGVVADAFLQHGKCLDGQDAWWLVAKDKFTHFYAIGTVLMLINCLLQPSPLKLTLLTVQLARRWWESVRMRRSGQASKMHLMHYLLGISYYLVLALGLSVVGQQPKVGPSMVAGISLICLASIVQNRVHWYLYGLRSRKGKDDSKVYQKIPQSGLFFYRWILCPHYLAEIIVYFGVWLADGSWLMALNLVFVTLNLSVTAYYTKKWYIGTIEPTKRSALIPGVL